jgi:peptidoglycan/xylan/chitin deacetylase (PgdA/CDA1 family)
MTSQQTERRLGAFKDRARSALKTAMRHGVAAAGRLGPASPPDQPRVLCYHGVNDQPPDEWSVTPDQLRSHLALIVREFHPVSVDDVVAWHRGEIDLPDRSIAVTFDDGFVDVLDTAAPLMAEYGVPGAAFIASTLADGGAPDPHYHPTRPLLDWSGVSELRRLGWTIGSHSLDHARLSGLGDAESKRQLVESRDIIEQHIGDRVTTLAYPYGTASTVSPREYGLAREAGYEAAFMDTTGALTRGAGATDPMALPRSKVLGSDSRMVVAASLRGQLDLWRFVERRGGGA